MSATGVSTSPTSVNESPTSNLNSPTAVNYSPPANRGNPTGGVQFNPNPGARTQLTRGDTVQDIINQNPGEPFLKIQTPDGTLYAVNGRLVSKQQFQSSLSGYNNAQQEADNSIAYRERKANFQNEVEQAYSIQQAQQAAQQEQANSIAVRQRNANFQTELQGLLGFETQSELAAVQQQSTAEGIGRIRSGEGGPGELQSLDQSQSLDAQSESLQQQQAELQAEYDTLGPNPGPAAVAVYNQNVASYAASVKAFNSELLAQAGTLQGLLNTPLTPQQLQNELGSNSSQLLFTVNGQTLTLAQIQQQYPGATVTYEQQSGTPFGGRTSTGQGGYGFVLSIPSQAKPGSNPAQNLANELGITSQGQALIGDLVGGLGYVGYLGSRPLALAEGKGLQTYNPQAGQQAGTYGLLAAAGVGIGFLAAPLAGAIIPETLSGLSLTGAKLAIQAGLGGGFGALSSTVTGNNPLTGAIEGAFLFPASSIAFSGLAAGAPILREAIESTFYPGEGIPSGAKFSLSDITSIFRTSTREFTGGPTPLLSEYEAPQELGEPEFAQSPGQPLSIKGGYLSTIFVQESGGLSASGELSSDVSALGEADIINSSVLAQKDLANLIQGNQGFVDTLTSRAPPKLPSAGSSSAFASGLVQGAEDIDVPEPTPRAVEVQNMFAKYDASLTNIGEDNQASQLLERHYDLDETEQEEPTGTSESYYDQAVREAQEQLEIRKAITRAIIGRGSYSTELYSFFVYPPGTTSPSLTSQTSRTATFQTSSRSQSLASITGLSTVQSPLLGLGLSSQLGLGQSSILGQSTVTAQSIAQITDLVSIQELSQESLEVQLQDSALLTAQIQVEATALVPALVPVQFLEKKRRRKTARKGFFDYSFKNQVSPNIAASFGDVGAELASDFYGSGDILGFGSSRRKR